MLSSKKSMVFENSIFVILLAVEVIMSFTALGYIHMAPISVTVAHVPVVIIAALFGWKKATIAGLLFGLGSMFKSSALYVTSVDSLFSPWHSGQPVESFILSVGTRAAFGFLIGWLFQLYRDKRGSHVWMGLLAFGAAFLHAFLVFAALGCFFPETGLNYRMAFVLDFNIWLQAVLCVIGVLASDAVYHSTVVSAYQMGIDAPCNQQTWSMRIRFNLWFTAFIIVAIAWLATRYFTDRTMYMLNAHGVAVSEMIQRDILYLQLQFAASMIALCVILLLLIKMTYHYLKYREYEGELDVLTEVMGRRLFLNYCVECQSVAKSEAKQEGWFLFVDVDSFKQINDTLGHVVGDNTLKGIAKILEKAFKYYGKVGRVGGDEFAVIVDEKMTRDELTAILEKLLVEVATVLPQRKVSCSIGVTSFRFPKEVVELMRAADGALYQAKEKGKNCFVIADELNK